MRQHLPPDLWTRLFTRLDEAHLSPEPVRRALDLPASTFYAKLQQHRQGGVQPRRPGSGAPRRYCPEDLEGVVRAVLRELPPVAGHRRVRRKLLKKGLRVSNSTTYRVTRDLGLLVPPRKGKVRKHYEAIRVEAPHQAWVADTTEWHVAGQKFYAYLAIDAYSRYCPGLLAALSDDAAHTVRFYEHIFQEGVPVVLHTDGGSEFDNRAAKELLRLRGVHWRPGPSHTPEAQGLVERFVKTLKEEWLLWKEPRSFKEFQECLDAFRAWYNKEREHSSIGHVVPEVKHRA